MSEERRFVKLSGKTNYLGWQRVMTAKMFEKGYASKKGVIVKDKEDEAYCLIMESLSLTVAQVCVGDTATKLLAWIKREYGPNDKYQAKQDLKNVKMKGIDLEDFWLKFNLAYASFVSAEGNMDYCDIIELIMENIHQTFFLDIIRKHKLIMMKLPDVNETHLQDFKDDLKEHYNATPEGVRDGFVNPPRYRSNNANGRQRGNRSERICDYCKRHNRWRIMKTHATAECRIGDVVGWGPREANNAEQNGEHQGNISDSNYVAYHDSGSTPFSFFKDCPENLRKKNSQVRVANNKTANIVGEGEVKFGKLKLKNVQFVPSFSKNLVSGIEIMKAGYRQDIRDNRLFVYDQDDLVATGTYNPQVGLIQMDQEISIPDQCNHITLDTVHQRMGHISLSTLKKTMAAVDGLKTVPLPKNIDSVEKCVDYSIGKLKK
jgi:hypothetical protein